MLRITRGLTVDIALQTGHSASSGVVGLLLGGFKPCNVRPLIPADSEFDDLSAEQEKRGTAIAYV
jgi:hypothetical protein